MTYDEIMALIRKHEGTRYTVYEDSVGVLTGGVGHAFLPGSKLPVEVVERLFYHDMMTAYSDFKVFGFSEGLSPARKAVIINMLFNLGFTRFIKFSRMIDAINRGDCDDVVKEMFDSRWASQVKGRSEELAMMWYDNKPPDYEPD